MLCFISSSWWYLPDRSLFHRPGCPATLFRITTQRGVYRGNALVKTKHTLTSSTGLSSCSAISSALGSCPAYGTTHVRFAGKRSAPLRLNRQTNSTGLVHNRPFNRLAIHQVAYVEKRKPRSGSNFSTRGFSPRLPSSIRSSNARPRCHNGGQFLPPDASYSRSSGGRGDISTQCATRKINFFFGRYSGE